MQLHNFITIRMNVNIIMSILTLVQIFEVKFDFSKKLVL